MDDIKQKDELSLEAKRALLQAKARHDGLKDFDRKQEQTETKLDDKWSKADKVKAVVFIIAWVIIGIIARHFGWIG